MILAFDRNTNEKMFKSKRAADVLPAVLWKFKENRELASPVTAYSKAQERLKKRDCCDPAALWEVVADLRRAIRLEYEERELLPAWPKPYLPHYELGRVYFRLQSYDAAELEWAISEKQKVALKNAERVKDLRDMRAACPPRPAVLLRDRHDLLGRRDTQRELPLPFRETVLLRPRWLRLQTPDLHLIPAPYDQAPVPFVELDGLGVRPSTATAVAQR